MFLHQIDHNININNQIRLTLDQFKILEPSYPDLPAGYNERYYERDKVHHINGPQRTLILESQSWEDGNRYFDRYDDFMRLQQSINQEEDAIKKAVQVEIDKRRPYDELRRREYPPIEQLVVAMWENLIEKQTKEVSGVKNLQKLRKQVREKYPKLEN